MVSGIKFAMLVLMVGVLVGCEPKILVECMTIFSGTFSISEDLDLTNYSRFEVALLHDPNGIFPVDKDHIFALETLCSLPLESERYTYYYQCSELIGQVASAHIIGRLIPSSTTTEGLWTMVDVEFPKSRDENDPCSYDRANNVNLTIFQ